MDRLVSREALSHVLLWALVAGAAALLAMILRPLLPALLLAGALAALTEPVVFRPVSFRLARLLPGMGPAVRDWSAAALAVAALALAAGGVALCILWAVLGSLAATADAVIGIALQDAERIAQIATQLADRITQLAHLYGAGAIDGGNLRQAVIDALTRTRVGPEFLHFLISGTGGFIANAALVGVTLFYLYIQGPTLVRWIARWLPLDAARAAILRDAHRATAYHLIAHVLARAAILGIGLGALAWAIGGLNGVLVAVSASMLALLPLVGPMVAWLPLAGLVWSGGDPGLAAILAVAGYAWTWVVAWLFRRVARRLGTDELWLEFLLFLGLIGGLLAFGAAGLVIGPAVILAARLAVRAVRLVYAGEGADDPPAADGGIAEIGDAPAAGRRPEA